MTTKKPSMIILACSGCSNVGRLSNDAAASLAEKAAISQISIAAIAANKKPQLEQCLDVKITMVNGCEERCAQTILENTDIFINNHLVITDLGIEKNINDASYTTDELELVIDGIQASCVEVSEDQMSAVMGKSKCACFS